MLTLLKEKYGFTEVVPVLVDVGQDAEDIKIAKERAETLNVNPIFFDAKTEFATEYIFRCIKANGSYQGYPVGTSMSRILIASKVAEVAIKEGAEAVAHGCTGKGNDQYRMEVAFRYYAPQLRVVAPVRELNLTRSVEEEMLKKQGIDPANKVGKIGGDINIGHTLSEVAKWKTLQPRSNRTICGQFQWKMHRKIQQHESRRVDYGGPIWNAPVVG